MDLLAAYCQQTGRTKTDVVRELIRSLKRKISDRPSR
ncbi:MAG: CopG family transcriptional regulator [Xenococcaceae cyanobacterium]